METSDSRKYFCARRLLVWKSDVCFRSVIFVLLGICIKQILFVVFNKYYLLNTYRLFSRFHVVAVRLFSNRHTDDVEMWKEQRSGIRGDSRVCD